MAYPEELRQRIHAVIDRMQTKMDVPLTENDISFFLQMYFTPVREQLLTAPGHIVAQEGFVDGLRKYSKGKYGLNPVLASAELTEALVGEACKRKIERAITAGDRISAALWSDIKAGSEIVTEEIIVADTVVNNKLSLQRIEQQGALLRDTMQQVYPEAQIDIFDAVGRNHALAVASLQEDKTGFSVARNIVSTLSEDPERFVKARMSEPRVILVGARLGQGIYEGMLTALSEVWPQP